MPRNITVTFDDGSTHVYQNAPDNITPDQVSQRASRDFGKTVTALDGGRANSSGDAAPTQAPQAPQLAPDGAKRAWDYGSAQLEKMLAATPGLSEADKNRKRDAFFNDPRIARLRVASAEPVPESRQRFGGTKSQRASDQQAADHVAKSGNFLTALKSGISRGAFGIPERIAAAAEAYLPSAITGNESDASPEEILAQVRQNTDADLDQSLPGNIIGQIMSGGAIGGAAAKSLGLASDAVGLTRAAAPIAEAAPVLSRVGKIAAAGGAGAAAQAAGEGSDVGTAAATGAVLGPVAVGLGKGLGFLLRPLTDVIPLLRPSAGKILRRLTNASLEDIEAKAAKYRQDTGAEPTLFELLPLEDRNKLASRVVGSSPNVSEQTADAVRQRVGNVGSEMADVDGMTAIESRARNAGPSMRNAVRQATAPGRQNILDNMANDMADARGGVPDISDPELAARAAQSPVDMEAFRRAEAGTRMQPVDGMGAADTVESLFPRSFVRDPETGEVSEVYSDPELNRLISNAAGALRLRLSPDNEGAAVSGLTVNDITRIIDKLGDIPPSSPDAMTAERAINHLVDNLPPEAQQATEAMRAAYAARSRMMEGMSEGGRTRTRASVPVDSRAKAQETTNAYDTPEGTAGRFLGQTNAAGRAFSGGSDDVLRAAQNLADNHEMQQALIANLGAGPAARLIRAAQSRRNLPELAKLVRSLNGTTRDALRAVGRFAEDSNTQGALAENVGETAAGKITAAAQAQDASVRALASVGRETSQKADELSVEDLGRMLLALNPQSMPTTKLFAMSRFTQLMHMPEKKARQLVDMLFSQDAAKTNAAIRQLNGAGQRGKQLLSELTKSIVVGARAGQAVNAANDAGDGSSSPSIVPSASAAEMPAGGAEPAADGNDREPDQDGDDLAGLPYGHAVVKGLFPEAHITEDRRDPNSALGRKNPKSFHVRTDEAVDLRPIPGMTFEDFIQQIRDAGYEVIESRDEVKNPVSYATGKHWHVVIG